MNAARRARPFPATVWPHWSQGRGLAFSWKAVEPLDEVHDGFAVVAALVELVADVMRETGDFADAAHGFRWLKVVVVFYFKSSKRPTSKLQRNTKRQ